MLKKKKGLPYLKKNLNFGARFKKKLDQCGIQQSEFSVPTSLLFIQTLFIPSNPSYPQQPLSLLESL